MRSISLFYNIPIKREKIIYIYICTNVLTFSEFYTMVRPKNYVSIVKSMKTYHTNN